MATKLHDAGVQESTAALIVGHKHEKLTFGHYGNKVDVEGLREAINKMVYSALDPRQVDDRPVSLV